MSIIFPKQPTIPPMPEPKGANEKVNHPKHYNQPGKKECIDEMVELFGLQATLDFCWLNCYKYLYRAGEKEGNSKEQDIEKAKWYFKWALDHQQYPHDVILQKLENMQESIKFTKILESLNEEV